MGVAEKLIYAPNTGVRFFLPPSVAGAECHIGLRPANGTALKQGDVRTYTLSRKHARKVLRSSFEVLSRERVSATILCPACTSIGTRTRPIAPVPPAMNMFIDVSVDQG